jgi:hypothetical protein
MSGRVGRLVVVGVLSAAAVVAQGSVVAAPASAVSPNVCSSRLLSSNSHEHDISEVIAPLSNIPTDVASVPTWSGSFATGGQQYHYRMVGTDPALGSATTSVPVDIIPLAMNFAVDHCTLAASGMAEDLVASPMFTPTEFGHGLRQYVDAVQRGSFWSSVGTTSPDWHLLLSPHIMATQVLQVPAGKGDSFFNPASNRPEGLVDGQWLQLRLNSLINSLHIDPGALAVFVPYNTFATNDNINDCFNIGCAYYSGFHGAVTNSLNVKAVNTYAFASFYDVGDQLPPQYDEHALVMSHEILEWANDPFDQGQRVNGQVTF